MAGTYRLIRRFNLIFGLLAVAGAIAFLSKSYMYNEVLPENKPEGRAFRFEDGQIKVSDKIYSDAASKLSTMTPLEVEDLFEDLTLRDTAECSTVESFGRNKSSKLDICTAGPFAPREPCFVFAFGIDAKWEFVDDLVESHKCQVMVFDFAMPQSTYMSGDKVAYLREGLISPPGVPGPQQMRSLLGHLRYFRADSYIIDVLKLDVDGSEWLTLETALHDNSLNNVKQLVLDTHINKDDGVEIFRRYFDIHKALYNAGFRQWRHNWNAEGKFFSKHNSNRARTCCHQLHYININFLTNSMPNKNPNGTAIAKSLIVGEKVDKVAQHGKLDKVLPASLTSMSHASLEAMYFDILEQQHITCPSTVRVGNLGNIDGDWDVCFSGPFNILNSKSCVAFSFGINYVWGYDDQLADKYKCQVHMFDPSMQDQKDHQRKKTSWFHLTGLSSMNFVDSKGWKMRTLCTLINGLGYGSKIVDLLKIDVEYFEWESLEKAVEEGCLGQVKQLLLETHTSELIGKKSDYARFIDIWRSLFKLGFRQWKWHKNPMSLFYKSAGQSKETRACCYEHYLLNMNFMES